MAAYWPYIASFLSPLLSFLVAYLMLRIGAARTASQQAGTDESTWRQARLDAEQALRDAIAAETRARTHWQLENDGDLERIAGILKDVNETNKLTATLAATSQHHGGELKRINTRVEGIGQQLNDFIMSHVKPA